MHRLHDALSGGFEALPVLWRDQATQGMTRGRPHYLTYQGKTLSVTDWAKELGIPRKRLERRVFLGWSSEMALSLPKIKGHKPGCKCPRCELGFVKRRRRSAQR